MIENETKIKKSQIRKEVLHIRKAMTKEEVIHKSILICNQILNSKMYKEAGKICLYMPINNEVDVSLIMNQILIDSKKIFLPKVNGKQMDFYYYDKNTKLEKGAFNIMEPQSEIILQPDNKTLVIMPGAVFSEKKDRIGYGGGYYDSFLANNKDVMKMAVAYENQILTEIPVEEFDIKPDIIVTDKRII